MFRSPAVSSCVTWSCIAVAAAATWLGSARAAAAQGNEECREPDTLRQMVYCRAKEIATSKERRFSPTGGRLPRDPRDARMFLLAMAVNRATSLAYEDSRVDEQTGAGAASAGSTSLVSTGAVPTFLSLALENGAVSQSASGSTLTFRGNVAGILKAVDKHNFLSMTAGKGHGFERLSNFTASASFDTTRGITEGQPARFVGDLQQLAAWSIRGELYNNHASNLASFWKRASGQVGAKGPDLDAEQLFKKLPRTFLDDQFRKWMASTIVALEAARLAPGDVVAVEAVLAERLRALPYADGAAGDVQTLLNTLADQVTTWMKAERRQLAESARGTIVTAELVTNRTANGVSLTTARGIWAVTWAPGAITVNGGVSFYPRLPAMLASTQKPWQSIEVATQYDLPFGVATGFGRFVFSAAYKFEHQRQDPIDLLTGLVAPGQKGNLHVGQAKVTIPAKGTGVKVPISVTIANRSDVVKTERTLIRGNIGVSYDLDALFARAR